MLGALVLEVYLHVILFINVLCGKCRDRQVIFYPDDSCVTGLGCHGQEPQRGSIPRLASRFYIHT